MWTAPEAIKGFIKEPVFVFVKCWITNRGTDDGEFIVGQNGMAKCIFAIALL
jgi:hypothetical protein